MAPWRYERTDYGILHYALCVYRSRLPRKTFSKHTSLRSKQLKTTGPEASHPPSQDTPTT